MKVGFSEIIITPESPEGIQLGGYAPRELCSGVHNDLFARAVYIEGSADIETHCLLIICDLLSINGKLYELVTKKISNYLPINKGNVMISATHTHHGPDYRGLFRPGGNLALVKGFLFPNPDSRGLIILGKKLLRIAVEAYKNKKQAKIGAIQTKMPKSERIIINRRAPFNNNKAEYPLTVIKVTSAEPGADGDLLGLILNYACHGTMLPRENTLITADYVGYLIKKLRSKVGNENTHFLYFNGPCGDINPLSSELKEKMEEKGEKGVSDADIYQQRGTWKDAKQAGEIIATQAVKVIDKIKCKATDQIQVIKNEIKIPIKDYPYGSDLQSVLNKIIFRIKLNLFSWLKKLKILKTNIFFNVDKMKIDCHVQSVIQVIQLGDIIIGTVPGEYFLELGNEVREYIKNLNPSSKPFIIELANDSIGYLYTIDAYREGGYESSFSIIPLGGRYVTLRLKKISNLLS
ncbi:MAG: neutral/alkaline non-lysosomal ceramidase N-terminal domain-containing protein [Promethearchaeia archaeon]